MIFGKGCPEGYSLSAPITETVLDEMNWYIDDTGNESKMVCPVVGKSHRLPEPPRYGSAEFNVELEEVVQARSETVAEVWPWWLFKKYWPFEFEFKAEVPAPLAPFVEADMPSTAARLVGMDSPEDFPLIIYDWLLENGATHKHATRHVDFDIRGEVLEDIGDGIKHLQTKFFEAKSYFLQPRPEEVLDIPGNIFTAYAVGCPAHASYPAGHATFTALILRLRKHLNIPDELWDVALTAAYHFAFYRTLAGVHYPSDNVAGIVLGKLVQAK